MILYSIAKFWDSTYRDDRWAQICFITSLILNIIVWLVLWLKIQPQSYLSESGEIFLHYNIYFGVDKIGSWYSVFVLPVLGLIVILANNLLAYVLYLKDKVLSYTLVGAQLVVQVILVIAALLVILLNS